MPDEITVLTMTAGSIALIHTISGPDHYLPFVAMSKAGDWSLKKTLMVTFLCGCGHVLGSVVLGLLGLTLSSQLGTLEWIEGFRGNLAAWALVAFGLVYMVLGLRQAAQGKDGHKHKHGQTTPWMIFIIFLLGPCEPLIPILMYPASQSGYGGILLVVAVFGAVTLATMLAAVWLGVWGMSRRHLPKPGIYGHAAAGATVACCGLSILFLGL